MHVMQEKLRQEREMQPVCRKCRTKHFVIPEEGVSCCPLDDIRFIKRFYTKKMNFPSANLVLGDDVLEFHVDPELFFFEKTFSLNVFEKIPFPMICKLVESEDVSDLYERLLALSIIKVNSMTNLISLSIILDYLKLFLSYPRPVQSQMLGLRNKLVLDNLKKDGTKSKGTQFLELFLTLMNRYWVHNKELDETIGLFDWTGLFEFKKNTAKPYFKIKGKKLQIPFPFEDDSNMEYIHPYKRNLLPDNNDRGMIMNTESGLCWIDANWVSHPVPEELYCKVINGEMTPTDAEPNGGGHSKSTVTPKNVSKEPTHKSKAQAPCVNSPSTDATPTAAATAAANAAAFSAGLLTERQTDQLVRAMYITHCIRRATEVEQQGSFTPISSNFIIPKDEPVTHTHSTHYLPAPPSMTSRPPPPPIHVMPSHGADEDLNTQFSSEDSRGNQLAEAFDQFQSRIVNAEIERANNVLPPENQSEDNPFGNTVYIPFPMPPLLKYSKGPDDDYYSVSDNEEKKLEYLDFIERNYGESARNAVANQLLPNTSEYQACDAFVDGIENESAVREENQETEKPVSIASQLEGSLKKLSIHHNPADEDLSSPKSKKVRHNVSAETSSSSNGQQDIDRKMREAMNAEALDMESLIAETLAKKLTSVFISHGVPCQLPVPLNDLKTASKQGSAQPVPSAAKPKPPPVHRMPVMKGTSYMGASTALTQTSAEWSTLNRLTTIGGKELMGVNPYPPKPLRNNRNTSPSKYAEARRAREARKAQIQAQNQTQAQAQAQAQTQAQTQIQAPKKPVPRTDSRKPVNVKIIKKLRWSRTQIANALIKRTPQQFTELKRYFATSADDSVWAIETGVFELRNLIDEESLVKETYAEWRKRNEDLIARFKHNALYLLDHLDFDLDLKPEGSQ
ncbi:unnamed protein product [Auanema sp. JU1783]|nr:unnamed protein product [Auanema sp. JU1783]